MSVFRNLSIILLIMISCCTCSETGEILFATGDNDNTDDSETVDDTDHKDGDIPDGDIPDGEVPDGDIPDGEVPDGEVPDGDIPDGDIPDGEVPDGEVPDGDIPDGDIPDGDIPDGEVPDGDIPDGDIPGICYSDSDCEMNEYCKKAPGASAGFCTKYCFVIGESCPEGTYCDSDPYSYYYGQCINYTPTDGDVPIDGDIPVDGDIPTDGDADCQPCVDNDDCEESMRCERFTYPGMCYPPETGCCVEKCSEENPCADYLECNETGVCVYPGTSSSCADGCPTGYVCDPLYGYCVLNCPECGPNECCDAESAPNCYICECRNPTVCGVFLPQCCHGYCCSAIIFGTVGYCI